MCETSKTPQPERTATCSGPTPSYWTGISHPANGTSRAPAASWASNRGVRRSSVTRRRLVGVLANREGLTPGLTPLRGRRAGCDSVPEEVGDVDVPFADREVPALAVAQRVDRAADAALADPARLA